MSMHNVTCYHQQGKFSLVCTQCNISPSNIYYICMFTAEHFTIKYVHKITCHHQILNNHEVCPQHNMSLLNIRYVKPIPVFII